MQEKNVSNLVNDCNFVAKMFSFCGWALQTTFQTVHYNNLALIRLIDLKC